MGACAPIKSYPNLASHSIQPLSLHGEKCLAYIIDVYDGDTCTANIQSKYGVHRWKIRMCGYDTPELKAPNETQEYKLHARTCANLLRELINNRTVVLQCYQFDKWGRVLADVYISNYPPSIDDFTENPSKYISINKYMIENTPAIQYNGKEAKKKFTFNRKFSEEYTTEFKRLVAQERAKLY
jgi:endonuclease YncB( thermonuclease family)